MCKFSVIVPVYKAEKFLNRCVESLLSQTCRAEYEIILVDDGSPDSSGEICDKYGEKDSRVVVIHKENAGVAQARETGLKVAKGEYTIFVDSDDWVSTELLEQVNKITSCHNVDMVCYGYYLSSKTGNIMCRQICKPGYYDRDKIQTEIFPLLLQTKKATCWLPSLCMRAIKTDILRKIYPQNCTIKYGEDGIVSAVATYYAQTIYILEDCLYYYWSNPESATKRRYVMDWNETRLRTKYFMQFIDMQQCDFKVQLNRRVVHSLFNVAISRFNTDATYHQVAQEIKRELSAKDYKCAIENAHFKGSVKAKMMEICMKYKMIAPIYLFSKIKNMRK